MAFYRSVKTLFTKSHKDKARLFFTAAATTTTTTTTNTTTALFLTPPFYTNLSQRPPFSRLVPHFQGPLFLAFPPWKLSQSATPFNGVVLRKVQALNLDLIRSRTNLPSPLVFRTGFPLPNVVGRIGSREEEEADGIWNSFVNLPNMVSMTRLVSGPFIAWMITNEMYSLGFVALAISGATDWLDGYIARRMKIDSVVGSYLDPLADKVLIGFVAVAMVHTDLLHPGLVGLVVLRDVALVGGALYQRASALGLKWKSWTDFVNLDGTCPQKVEPLFLSKVNTVFQLVLVAAALLQPEFGTLETESFLTYLSLLVASTTVASTAAYGVQHMRKKSALMSRNL